MSTIHKGIILAPLSALQLKKLTGKGLDEVGLFKANLINQSISCLSVVPAESFNSCAPFTIPDTRLFMAE
jgi:hypothetical protein